MAFESLDTDLILPGKAVKAEVFTKLNGNVEDLNARLTTVEGGVSKYIVFDGEVRNACTVNRATGLCHWKALANFRLTKVSIQLFEKNPTITSGHLEIDVKKNSTPANFGMQSVLSVTPIIDFASAVDYQEANGTLDPVKQYITAGDILRFDILEMPTVPLSRFMLTIYGEV